MASPDAARPGRARGGRPRSKGPIRSSTVRAMGRTSACAAPRANGRPTGGNTARRRAADVSSWSLRSKTARGVPRGQSARGRSSRDGAWDSPRKRSTRRRRRLGRGSAVRRVSNSINSEPESKGRCPKAYAALGCGTPDTGGSRKPISNRSRPPRR
jgi:hypothetical protein